MISFEDLHVSTRTVIVSTNLTFDIEKLFHSLPLSMTCIRSIQYKDQLRTVMQPTSTVIKKKRYFRNSITLVMQVDTKKTINCKISNKGNVQITGCSKHDYAKTFIRTFWKLIQPTYLQPSVYFLYVMNNVDFSIGFNIDLTKLHNYFASLEKHSEFKSILEPAFGYVGLKVSFPVVEGPDLRIPYATYKNGDWVHNEVPYSQYMEEKNLKMTDSAHKEGRFLVFRTGKVILTSGKDLQTMKSRYYEFYKLLQSIRSTIEERIIKT